MTDGYIYIEGSNSVLELRYRALLAAFETADQCKLDFKTFKGNCPPDLNRANPKHRLREREYERAYLRLHLALKTMHPLMQPVWEAAQDLRREFEAQDELRWYSDENRIMANNVLAAEILYEEACQLYFAVIGVLETPHFDALQEDWSKSAPERFFVVRARLDDFLASAPQPPYLTRAEAEADVSEGYGNSGWFMANIYDVRQRESLMASTEAARNPQLTKAQEEKLPLARYRVQRLINSKRPAGDAALDRVSILVESDDTAIAMQIAKELREKGWQVVDHFFHQYSTFELWVSGNGQPLDK